MARNLENRIRCLERAHIARGNGIDTILIVRGGDIKEEEQDKALEEYYKEHPEARNPVGIITLELRRDENGYVKVRRG